VLSSLAIHELCDECRRHLSSSYGHLSSGKTWPFLVKLIHVPSIHVFDILISSYTNGVYHQHQPSLVWLFPLTFDEWFTSLSLKVFRPNLGTRFFLGGKVVTVHVFVTLGKYFVSVKYVFVCIKLMCVYVKLFENLKVQIKRVFS
jgi:hypothetical protein